MFNLFSKNDSDRSNKLENFYSSNDFNDLIQLRESVNLNYEADEYKVVTELLAKAKLSAQEKALASQYATEFVTNIRKKGLGRGGLDAFMLQYDLSSQEGTALMCMAEALLRIPDNETRDRLIRDKIGTSEWDKHMGQSKVLFVNAATYALMLTGKIVKRSEVSKNNLKSALKKLVEKSGEPVIRKAVATAMKILGRQFVMAESIDAAIERAQDWETKGYTYSYDMLGEAARTDDDANYYYNEYINAIGIIAKAAKHNDVNKNPGISIKLSALDARYELFETDRVKNILIPRVKHLAKLAEEANIGFTIDAEESERLDISLNIFESVFVDMFKNNESKWSGFGLAVQAYQKRSYSVLEYLNGLSKKFNKKIMVRLVKGAYWDREIKYAQVEGHKNYPVFTRKPSTDVSYMACAKYLLANADSFYPQFATHNAYTLGAILALSQQLQADNNQEIAFEFQRLHGMGEALYEQVVGVAKYDNRQCRIYAPVGGYKHLLAYLVRRLLENGANSSFVNRLVDEKLPISEITKCPIEEVEAYNAMPHPKIKLPRDIINNRVNSKGINIFNIDELNTLKNKLQSYSTNKYISCPIIGGISYTASDISKLETSDVVNPANNKEIIGQSYMSDENLVDKAVDVAKLGFQSWSKTSVQHRAECLNKMADLIEDNMDELIYLCVTEAGRTVKNVIAEIREAVDFCRYYANIATDLMGNVKILASPTGEHNQISMHPKGVFVCISPWNFPLAIYVGQIVAALVTGNTVIAKPAEQTPLIAYFAANLLYKSGIPKDAFQYLPGHGSVVGARLTQNKSISGVLFTGSYETASLINKSLANREYADSIATVVAETGGLNAMIVDSSSLPEQVVADVINSAFDSAGQRCSALRLLYVQEDIADSLINMLTGAMKLLSIGDPKDLSTDVGPVIDKEARENLQQYIDTMETTDGVKKIYNADIEELHKAEDSNFFPIYLYELDNSDILQKEVFGPVLHLVRYKSSDIDKVIDKINNTGYALTFGIHSRIEEFTDYVCSRIKAGNCYINRNTIGAVVGMQPFGGNGLSGTGPKAGGPNYLTRLCTEKTISIDTTASGGNASLLCLD